MERKDDIGEFINEKLGSAKKVAPANLWDRIDTSLEKRRKRRGLLFFWSGLIGLLVIAVVIGGLTGYFNPNEAPSDRNNEILISSEEADSPNLEQIIDGSSEKYSETIHNHQQNDTLEVDSDTTETDSNSINTSAEIETNSEKTTNTSISEVNANQTSTGQTKTGNSLNTLNKNVATNTQSSYSVDATPNRKPDAISQLLGMVAGKTTDKKLENTTKQGDPSDSFTTTYYYYDSKTDKQFVSKNKIDIDSLRAAREMKDKTFTDSLHAAREMKSNAETLAKSKDAAKDDTASKKEVETNELELATTEKDSTPSQPKTNFSISGHLVPLYFGPSQTESPIDRSLETNDKRGAWNLGFGLMGNYRFNKNAMISLGAYYSKMSYTTNNIFVESQVQRDTILNYLRVQNDATITSTKINTFFSGSKFGKLKQAVSYVEIPLQFNYLIPKDKFEFSMMGGFSTYFLLDDSFTLINEANQELVLGKATNLSTVSLSLNAGVGFNYQLSPKIALDVQPVFKYRIRTLNQATFNGETATFSFLTGVRYKF